ncbi:hypothetical protein HI914_02098 [Erysiphe necator]|nr:hypothetical protein HI914_02098 [Erysiphe necator]
MDPTQDMNPFRSDPIAGPEPSGGEQFFSQADKSSNNRKRHNCNEIPIPLLSTKFIKITKKYSGEESHQSQKTNIPFGILNFFLFTYNPISYPFIH